MTLDWNDSRVGEFGNLGAETVHGYQALSRAGEKNASLGAAGFGLPGCREFRNYARPRVAGLMGAKP
ncbi:MAG: hypothetical protein JWR21_1834 [Herminiimonas sp.]|nr:hypothetical protein [Herminiimonas sp.]